MSRLSTRKRKHRPIADLRAAARALAGADEPGSDPFAGCMGRRALLYSCGHDGARIPAPRRWDAYSPQQILVRGDGHTTAHAGSIVSSDEPSEERLARAAGLSADEAAVLREQVGGARHSAIVAKLGLTPRQVETRVESINRKLRQYGSVLRAMGTATW